MVVAPCSELCCSRATLWTVLQLHYPLNCFAVAPPSESFCSRATLWTVLQLHHPLNCFKVAPPSESFCSRATLWTVLQLHHPLKCVAVAPLSESCCSRATLWIVLQSRHSLNCVAVAPPFELCYNCTILWTVLQSRHPLNCVTTAPSSELYCSRATLWTVLQLHHPLNCVAVAPPFELCYNCTILWTVLQSRHPLNCVTTAPSSELCCSRAILSNDDVLPQTPLLDLLRRDFWGTPLAHSGSHGSYRPLAVLSFRLNVLLAGGRVGHGAARGFHVFNTLLHAAATAAFTRWVRVLTPHRRRFMTPWVSGLLFAVHPVHAEAVAGIVGKYMQHIERPIPHFAALYFSLLSITAILSALHAFQKFPTKNYPRTFT